MRSENIVIKARLATVHQVLNQILFEISQLAAIIYKIKVIKEAQHGVRFA